MEHSAHLGGIRIWPEQPRENGKAPWSLLRLDPTNVGKKKMRKRKLQEVSVTVSSYPQFYASISNDQWLFKLLAYIPALLHTEPFDLNWFSTGKLHWHKRMPIWGRGLCHSGSVEVKGQLAVVTSFLPPCGSRGSSTSLAASTVTHLAFLLLLIFQHLKIYRGIIIA